jgi:DNA-directed RNA polymerase specialized sigma24 family protein
MDRLARELAELAWELQRDAYDLRAWANLATRSDESVESTAAALARIEGKLGAVHGQTSQLIERVPKDLGQVLAELRQALVLRLDEAARATVSAESDDPLVADTSNRANQTNHSPVSAVRSLTPQERRVFEVCFQSGLLSYRDIAGHLEITPTAAKNLVNRIFQSDRKRPLFTKEHRHGAVRISVRPGIQEHILGSRTSETETKHAALKWPTG